jgi:hypothetical protein
MLPRTVITQTIERFPAYAAEDFEVRGLEKGGSDRKFYRIRCAGHSMIVVKYSCQKEENRHYVDIAQFLGAAGVSVPQIYFHDAAEGLIWMQDLGEDDLWAFRQSPWETRRPLYESALREVSKMHTAATRRMEGSRLSLEREFSEQLYLWEQNYFFENCLRAHFGLDQAAVQLGDLVHACLRKFAAGVDFFVFNVHQHALDNVADLLHVDGEADDVGPAPALVFGQCFPGNFGEVVLDGRVQRIDHIVHLA